MIISPKQQLMQFFNPDFLLSLAKKSGFIIRQRTLEPASLILALISSMSKGDCKSIAEVHRQYNGIVHSVSEFIDYKPFHNQLRKEAFSKFVQLVVDDAFSHITSQCLQQMPEKLSNLFSEILLQDGSSIQVHKSLENEYPSRFKSVVAAVECHMTMSLIGESPTKMTITPDTSPEREYLPGAQELKGKLLLADAGYTSLKYFSQVSEHGGYFIMRGDSKFNPFIVYALLRRFYSVDGNSTRLTVTPVGITLEAFRR